MAEIEKVLVDECVDAETKVEELHHMSVYINFMHWKSYQLSVADSADETNIQLYVCIIVLFL